MKAKLAILLFAVLLLASTMACGGTCYSQHAGCEATMEVVATAAASQ